MTLKRLVCALLMCLALCAGAEGLRALSVTINEYDDGRSRTGGLNSAQGVADALGYFNNECALLINPTKAELLDGISDTFSESAALNLIYINSHGGAQNNTAWIETREGALFTAAELENAARSIDGTVILIIDCCGSGGFIGKAAAADKFAAGIIRAFDDNSDNVFASDKYYVITSCSYDQNSYRAATGSGENNTSTIFARVLCEGLGWDLVKDAPTSSKADVNADGIITFQELCLYTRQRCLYYLSFSSPAHQTVQFSPGQSYLEIIKK